MPPPIESLLVLIVVGAAAGIALAPRLEGMEPARSLMDTSSASRL